MNGKNETEGIEIPENIATWIEQHDGVNVAFNLNSASADHGYAHVIHKSVVVSILTRTCNRCGYDPLWKPDDSESKCRRHTYGAYRYDTVFAWSPDDNEGTLEECFDIWSKKDRKRCTEPCEYMAFGRFGWR